MAIIKTEAYFHSTNGSDMCRTLIWADDDCDPVGILQISHGLTDHIDRYNRFARFMAENGFIVCGNDHIGHGKTAKTLTDLGDFGAPDADIRMVDDMHVLHNIMSNRYPGLPYFLIGHSMGSFLSRIYAAEFGHDLSGLICCGTTQISGKLSGLSDYTDVVADIIGKDKFSSTGSEVLGKITARYYKEEDENSWLSLSKENREEADADPYFDYPISNASAMNVAKMLLKCSSDECIASIPQTLPVLLISGGKDPIGFFGRGVISFCDKLEENGIDTQIQIYPGLRHEILNEDDYQRIYEDILTWCYRALQGEFQNNYQGDFE